ncbi:MAG: YpmS family protein [Bacillus sp. (in: firmicutes)]
MEKKERNVWKILFFALSGMVLAVLIAIFVLVGIPSEVPLPDNTTAEDDNPVLEITSSKENLNEIIAQMIQKQKTDQSLDFSMVLTDSVELYTVIPVFDREIQLKMTFQPETLDNGDIILKQETMQLGQMRLPVSYVLNFISNQASLPEWMIIDPANEQIYIALSEIELPNNLKLQANRMDLVEDDISFHVVFESE